MSNGRDAIWSGACADEPTATTPNWEHLRVVGSRLGVPCAVSFGALPARSVAIGDFDGDGDADIVVGAPGAREVAVILGRGSGWFGSAVVAAREDWPTVDAVAEVDGIGYHARSSALSSTTTVRYQAVTATGRSGERVTSSPAGINVAVGSTGSASFAVNTSITLSVTNGRDAIWSGACSTGGEKTRTCTFTITGNASVTANVQ